jgi:hypothetical protein
MSVIDCLGQKLAILIQKRDSLSSNAAEGPLGLKRRNELEKAAKAFESDHAETVKLIEDLKTQYGDDPVRATQLAAQEAHAIMSERLAFRAKNAIETAAKAKTDAMAIISSVSRGAKVEDAIQAKYYGGFRPGNMTPREMFMDLSFHEKQLANRSLLDGGLTKAFDDEAGNVLKLIQRGDYNDQIGKAYFDLINETKTPGVTKEALAVAKKLQEQATLWEGRLNNAGIYTRTKARRFASMDISPRGAQKLGKEQFTDLVNNNLWWDEVAKAAELPTLAKDADLQAKFVAHMFDHLSTGGSIRVGDFAPFKKAGTSTIMNTRGHQGLMLLKDFQSWKNVHEKVGATDFFIEHIHSQSGHVAQSLATAETFGGSPSLYLSNLVENLNGHSTLLANEVKESMSSWMKADFAPQSGYLKVNEMVRATLGTLTNQARSSLLGNIMPQALLEPISSAAARTLHGYPPVKLFFKTLGEMFNPNLNSDRVMAARLGKQVYAWLDAHMESPRNKSLSMLEKYGAKGTSATMKYTGGLRATNAERMAMISESEAMLMDWADGLVPNNRFKVYQDHFFLSEADKPLIKRYQIEDYKGSLSKTLDLEAMYSSGDKKAANLAQRLAAQFANIQQLAAPDRSPVLDRFFKNMEANGVFGSIASRSLRTFTGFMGGMYFHQLKPILSLPAMSAARYATGQLMASMVTSAIYVQLMRLASGKDMLPVGPELAMKAALAIPFGMYGKFVMAGVNNNWDIADLSVALSAMKTHAKLPVNIVTDLYNGRAPDSVGRDLANIGRFWTPGSNTWFGRHILNKYVYDQLEYYMDGDAATKRWNQARRREEKAGSGVYAPRGPETPLIERAPNIENAIQLKKE